MTIETAILIFTTLIGAIGTVYGLAKAKAEKRKITAEAEKVDVDAVAVISNSAIALLGPMEKQVSNLETRLQATTQRANELENKYETVSAELDYTRKSLQETLSRCEELETLTKNLLSELRRYQERYGKA
jgi:chromosome segregation ATPase